MNLTSLSQCRTQVLVGSPREPVQSRALKTRAALLSAAASEFNERGYAQTTTKSIADRADVAAGSFYQYFADKDAVLRELAAVRMAQLQQRMDGIDALVLAEASSSDSLGRVIGERLRALLSEVLTYHRCEPGLHAVLSERRSADQALDAMTSTSERWFVGKLEAVLAHVGFSGDRKATAFVLFAMIEGAVHGHVLGTRVVPDKRFVEALIGAIVAVVTSGFAVNRAVNRQGE